MIGGAESWGEIAEFGRTKADWFAAFLELPNGLPSQDTFGRVFAQVDAAQFEAGFADWMPAVTAVLPTPVSALEGQTLRRSPDRGAGKAARQLVRAWATANQLVRAQVAVDDQSTEITAFAQGLRPLALTGCLVTIAAMGCQTALAEPVREQEADDVLALKENPEDLDDAVVDRFTLARASGVAECAPDRGSSARQVGTGHGRLAMREHWGDRRTRRCGPR